jgi:hypothetical protein
MTVATCMKLWLTVYAVFETYAKVLNCSSRWTWACIVKFHS